MHKQTSRSQGLIVAYMVVALIATACGSSGKKGASPPAPVPSGGVRQGGDITVGAEQEPDCMDWIGSCAGSTWGIWTVETNTMPRAYDFTDAGYKPSPLLTGDADVKSGPPQVVTYHINPKAIWDDGQPITSTDFRYTWDQIAHGKNIYDTSGYADIASVDGTDPYTAVVTFSQTFADWRGLFGSNYGLLPSHLLQGQDRGAVMKDGYKFSGGPWELDHWTKGSEIKLVRNPRYWAKMPNLTSVTFKIITDTAAEQQDYQSGQILAYYPQAQPGGQSLRNRSGTYFDAVTSLSSEGVFFNVQKAPLTSEAVRQALAYATDRDAIVKQLFATIQPDIKPIQSFFTPAFGKAYTEPFAKYHQDLGIVSQLMTADGWIKGADGIWAKGTTRATIELKTTAGNKRRQLTAEILQNEWQQAGFQLTITPETAGILFGQDLPSGHFQAALATQSPSDNDPSECSLWCSTNVPTAANGNTGENYDRISNPDLDKYWQAVDANLDTDLRITNAQDGQKTLADLVPALPIDAFPDILVIDSDKIGVEGGTFQHNFAYGAFGQLSTWFAK